jgi:hypothetical protein
MDLCLWLTSLGIVITVIALVGHGLWLLISAFVRTMVYGPNATVTRSNWNPSRRLRCPRCGANHSRELSHCPSCRLATDGPLAEELSDLEAVARCLQLLRDRGSLDEGLAEQVYQQVELRQQQLLRPESVPSLVKAPVSSNDNSETDSPVAPVELPSIPELPSEPITESPAETPVIVNPPPTRRSWGQMFAAFMEERNIMWGELVGGLLIVGCSIALVVSLWRTLEEQIHSFPFLVMTALTGSLVAAGQYSHRHWKLEATSRGLLVITALLTPLCFLVLAGLSPGRSTGWIDWLLGLAAVMAYGAMVTSSGRVTARPALSPGSRRSELLLALAVIGSSASQLFVPRGFAAQDWTVMLSFVPVVLQVIAIGWLLTGLGSRRELAPATANALDLFLAQTGFAAVIALSFLVYQGVDPIGVMRQLAIPVALFAWPALIVGAMTYSRVRRTDSESTEEDDSAAPRITGTVIAIVGALGMAASLGLAWPRPAALTTLGFANGILFFAIALVFRWPSVHFGAAASFSVGILTSYHWARGALDPGADPASQLLTANLTPSGALGLTLLAGVLILLSEVLARIGRRHEAGIYAGASSVAGLASVIVILRYSLTPAGYESTLVFGLVGLTALLVNSRWRLAELTIAGSMLVLGFNIQLANWLWPAALLAHRWLFSLLAHATVFGIGGVVFSMVQSRRGIYGRPMLATAVLTSVIAVVPLCAGLSWAHLSLAVVALVWVALLWIMFAIQAVRPGLLACGQVALILASLVALAEWMLRHEWITASAGDLFQTPILQTLAFGPAIVGIAWAMVKLFARRLPRGRALLEPEWSGVDRLVLVLLVAGQLLLAVATLRHEISNEILGGIAIPDHARPSLALAGSLVVALAVGLVLGLWADRPQESALALLLLFVSVPYWVAHGFRDQAASASAVRWALPIAFVVLSLPIWIDAWFSGFARRCKIAWPGNSRAREIAKMMMLAVTAVPVIGVSIWVGGRIIGHLPIAGPQPGTLFATIGWPASLIIPLVITAIGLTVHAIRDRSGAGIFTTALVLVLTICGGVAVIRITRGELLGAPEIIGLTWLGTLTLAVWALIWRFPRWCRDRWALSAQLVLASSASIVLLAWAVIQLLVHVGLMLPASVSTVSQPMGWAAVGLTGMATALVAWKRAPPKVVHVVTLTGIGFGVLAACSAVRRDASGWTSYHVLTLAGVILASVLFALAWLGESHRTRSAAVLRQIIPARSARRWIEALSVPVVLLGWGGAWGDPSRPYWSCATTLGIAVLFAAMAMWIRRPTYVYFAGLLLQFAAYFFWQSKLVDQWGVHAWLLTGPGVTDRFISMQALALATGSAIWSIVESLLRRRPVSIDVRSAQMPYVYLAALLAVQLIGILILTALAGNFLGYSIQLPIALNWLTLGLTGLALALGFRDPEANLWGMPAAALYVCGLFALGLGIHQYTLTSRDLALAAGPALGIYVLVVSLIVRYVPRGLGHRLGFVPSVDDALNGWYQIAQSLIGATALAFSIWMCLDRATFVERLAGPTTVFVLFIASLLPRLRLAEDWDNIFQRRFRPFALGVLFAVELAWSGIDPFGPAPWLHRHAWLLLVLSVSAAACVSVLPHRSLATSRSAARVIGIMAAVDLVAFLIHELLQYDPGARRTPLCRFDTSLVAGLPLLGIVALVRTAAARPRTADENIALRKRCVWVAELLFVLMLLHLRLNVPDLFPTFFGRHWHFVIMAVSFVGIGLAELFRRRGLTPLADPLQQTGLFLPLLPIVAYLIRPLVTLTQLGDVVPGLQPVFRYVDRLPHHYGIHSVLWFLLGSLYALVAVFRRATGYALAAALAANFGLWVLYANDPDWAFRLHPQLWLLPIGLILLAAEYTNRDRVPASTATVLRMSGLLVVYGSSAADMFIAGLGNSIVLPVLLAFLSVMGVLAGVFFRIRGYLFAGMAFLFLIVFSQIWHAAVDREQTWVWWASGIVLGLSILGLFAVFEKRRAQVVQFVEDMKHWR